MISEAISSGSINFNLPPDNPPGILTNWLVNNGDGTYKVSFQWEHTITTAEDPSFNYVGFNARWIIEGTATLQNGPPQIELSGGAVDVPLGSPYVEPGADCLDTIDGPINNKLVVTTNPVTDLSNPTADFQVIYNCQDSGGLDATTQFRNVTVSTGPDIIPPVITLNACTPESGIDCSQDGSSNASAVSILVGKTYVDGGGTCLDNVDQNIPLTGSGPNPNFTSNPFPASVDTSTPTGNTPAEIVFSCTDTAGNSDQAIRAVNVIEDTFDPVIQLNSQPQNVTVGINTTPPDPAFGITCTDTNPIDNPGGTGNPEDITANLDFTPTTIDTSVEGTTEVTYTCVDDAGNAATPIKRTFTVVAGQAFEIISMTISDINADGIVGCFRFNPINPSTCDGANRFSSDASAADPNAGTPAASIPGTGTDLDADNNPIGIRFGTFQPVTAIAQGFLFTGFPFQPFTADPPTEDAVPPKGYVVVSGNTAIMQFDSFPWSGLWTSSKPNYFLLDPDENTLDASIVEVDPVIGGSDTRTFKYRMSWSHLITAQEDQTGGQFTNFNARWLMEGVITANSTPTVLNDPPVINSLTAADQNFVITRIIISDNGLVTATVEAEDPNDDTLSYQWTGPVTPVGGTTSPVLTFDSNGLSPGLLTLTVTVTDDADPPLSTSQDLTLNIVKTAPDPDYGDKDNDGIPNYLDPIDGTVYPTRNLRNPQDPEAGEVVSSAGNIRLGNTAFSTGNYAFTVSEHDIGVEDRLNMVPGLGHSGGGIYDFEVDNIPAGSAVQVVLPQATVVSRGPIYRKYTTAKGWFDFAPTGGNEIASAQQVNGVCPSPDSTAYDDGLGLVQGDDCVRLTIVDGSGMDADGVRNGRVSDPGTVADNGPVSSGGGVSSGCTVDPQTVKPVKRGDWLLLGVFIASLGWIRRKYRRSVSK